MHGIEECKKGTPRHVQKSNDTKSASVRRFALTLPALILPVKQFETVWGWVATLRDAIDHY